MKRLKENCLEDNKWSVMKNNTYTLERSTFLFHSSIFMIFTCDNKMLESNWLKLVNQNVFRDCISKLCLMSTNLVELYWLNTST